MYGRVGFVEIYGEIILMRRCTKLDLDDGIEINPNSEMTDNNGVRFHSHQLTVYIDGKRNNRIARIISMPDTYEEHVVMNGDPVIDNGEFVTETKTGKIELFIDNPL